MAESTHADKIEPKPIETANDSHGRGISLTELADVRKEAGSLYNFCRKQWRIEGKKINPTQAKALANLLSLVKASIVEDEIERRLAALEQEKRASSDGAGFPAGTIYTTGLNGARN